MRTLLVLGASEGQLPVIRQARHLGLHTIAVDQNPAAVGVREADEFLCVSTRDVGAIRRALGRRRVAGVISPASDASALAVRDLSLAYGTAFCPSRKAALASLDKAYFRRVVDRLPMPHYPWVAGRDAARLSVRASALALPVVVKPCQSSGSKGISVVDDLAAIDDAIRLAQKFGFGGEVIVEQLVDGAHYSAECFIENHRPAFSAVIRRTITAPPQAITVEQSVSAEEGDAANGALDVAVTSICRALDLESGPLNVDFVLTPTGRIQVVEVAARLGGNGISPLLRHAYGVDLTEASVRLAVGDPVELRPQRRRAVLLRILEADRDGIVTAIHGADEIAGLPETVEFELFAGIGTPVHPYNEAAHKIGYLAMAGDSDDAVRAALDRALTLFNVEVAPVVEDA